MTPIAWILLGLLAATVGALVWLVTVLGGAFRR